jgi:H+-translocating NAD(P) transhydrogenase subunit alpha
MTIGILKEGSGENRVALLPDHVLTLKKFNVEVILETQAGFNAAAPDSSYVDAGAQALLREEILNKADLLISLSMPSSDIISRLRPGQIVLGGLNPLQNKDLVDLLVHHGITSFSLDFIPRTSRAQSMDILSSMATVAGYKAVLDAAMHLPRFFPMFMSAAGTIKPAKVLILGAGVAGLQAIAVARKLGAVVEVFDVRSAVKDEVKSLGGKFIEVEGAKEESSAGGYAVEQTEEFKQKQRQLIHDHAKASDVVICTAQIPGKKAPVLLTKTTVEKMRPGSVVIDLAASTGGNCEVTQNGKVIVHNHISIVGRSDYPSDMPFDASKMYGNNCLNFLKLLIDEQGKINLNFTDDLVKGTCITHEGKIVNERYKQLSMNN